MTLRILLTAAGVLYPLLVYAGLRLMQPRSLALMLGAVLVARLAAGSWRHDRRAAVVVAVPVVSAAGVTLLAGLSNDARFLLFVPALMNLALLAGFARTLRRGPSLVEALARLQYGSLMPGGGEYCRRVTAVWCGFFIVNTAVILALALFGSLEAWTLYTGLVAYGMVGMLFASELTYRSWRFRHYQGAMTDPLFRRLFPPRPTA